MTYPYHASLLKNDKTFVDVENVYRFRHDRKWPWLQALLFWVLRKLRANDQVQSNCFGRIDINLRRFGDFLQAYVNEIYRLTGTAPKRALVGWRTMERFVSSGEWKEIMCNPQRIDLPYGNRYAPYERGQYLGFSLLTLPWFEEGIIFLPNDL